MGHHERLIALIERRFDEIEFLLLDRHEQERRLERGGTVVDSAVARLVQKLEELEKRVDEAAPEPLVKSSVKFLRDRVQKLEQDHADLSAQLNALERSTSRRKPNDSKTPR